jgi:hypothetical protein
MEFNFLAKNKYYNTIWKMENKRKETSYRVAQMAWFRRFESEEGKNNK